MTTPRVYLGGEGRTELGALGAEPAYLPRAGEPYDRGLLEVLLRRLRQDLHITGATQWKRIRKLRTGAHEAAEERNVLGLCLAAKESGATIVAFARDRDRDEDRERAILTGMARAAVLYPSLAIVGGVATEAVEAWVLSLLGDRQAAKHARPKEPLREQHRRSTLPELSEVCEDGGRAPCEEVSGIAAWLDQARQALGT